MKLVVRFVLAFLLLGVIFGGIFGYQFYTIMQAGGPPGGQPPVNVMATKVSEQEWQDVRNAVGSLTAFDQVSISTEVAGTIGQLAFDSGDTVSTGDILVILDDDVDQAQLDGLRAEAELARIEFARAEELRPRQAISQSEFDESRARLDSAIAAVQTQEARTRQKTIRAPFDGVLGLRRVSVGQFLAPGSNIVELRRLDPLFVDFTVPERFLPDISVGQALRIEVSAYPDTYFDAEISAIEPGISEQTRSISLRGMVDNADARLRSGMFARVAVQDPSSRPVLAIPETAISFNTYGDFAFRINETDAGLATERVQIQTGERRDGLVEVIDGLAGGDQIVAAGLLRVRPGQAVTIDDDNASHLDPAGVTEQ